MSCNSLINAKKNKYYVDNIEKVNSTDYSNKSDDSNLFPLFKKKGHTTNLGVQPNIYKIFGKTEINTIIKLEK